MPYTFRFRLSTQKIIERFANWIFPQQIITKQSKVFKFWRNQLNLSTFYPWEEILPLFTGLKEMLQSPYKRSKYMSLRNSWRMGTLNTHRRLYFVQMGRVLTNNWIIMEIDAYWWKIYLDKADNRTIES